MKCSAVLGLLLILLVGCTAAPPEILQDHADVYLFRDRTLDTTYERLAFFVSARDDDGFDDIETLYLVHDDSRLHWAVDADGWQREEREEETWIGRNDIQMADYSSLPRGVYRILLLDAAGERDEREVRVATPDVPPQSVQFPELSLSGDRFLVESVHDQHTVHAFNAAGALLGSEDVTGTSLPVAELIGSNREALSTYTIFLYSVDEENGIPLLVGPYQF